ncbi:MAG: hypothetical protein V7L05_00245 [Nostoc sp.]|uniref:hypothetical protein n=1 Tax=Nostoc sp. TaxID=1180 RepID=UPI002FFAEE5A
MAVIAVAKAVRTVGGKRAFNSVLCDFIAVLSYLSVAIFDEAALRKAAGNPRGCQPLQLPDIRRLEQLPDPKDILYELLCKASGLTGRRLKQFSVNERVHRLAELIDDFSPLRALSAFQLLETEIQQVIKTQGWCS